MSSPKSNPARVDVGGAVACLSVRIDITADDLKPGEITALLGVTPTTAWEKGTVLLRRDGSVRRTTKSGRWSLSLQPAETVEWEADEAVKLIIGRFQAMESIWRDIAARAEIRLSLVALLDGLNQAISLEPESLRWLADRNIRLDIDIYAADESDLELSGLERMSDRGPAH